MNKKNLKPLTTKVTYDNSQKGQTILMVMMIMFIALFVGITASSRFMKSLRNIIASDNSTKAVGIAESLVERLLLIPSDTLITYISNNSCGSNCTLSNTDTTGQLLTATAVLSLVGNSATSYPISISQNESGAVTLTGYTSGRLVYVCWNGSNSITGQYIYSQTGVIKSTPFAYNAVLAYDNGNGFSSATANFGYNNCFSLTASQTPLSLRLNSVYGDTDVQVLPEPGYNIPIQGIQIVSTGKAGSAVRKVTVIKSTPYAPTYFDFTLYQKSEDESLSN